MKIIDRVIKMTGIPKVLNTLGTLPSTDLHSLLLELYRIKAEKLNAGDVSNNANLNRFVTQAKTSQRAFIVFDSIAYDTLPRTFHSVELSPVAPFGLNRVLGGISQNKVMSTLRNTEVVADPTSMLAVLCAHERRAAFQVDCKSAETVSMATSHRMIRQQTFKGIHGFTPHFRAFALATAGRDTGCERFEKKTISEHLTFHLSLLQKLEATGAYQTKRVVVALSNIQLIEELVRTGYLNRAYLQRKTRALAYAPFCDHDVPLPPTVHSMTEIQTDAIKKCNVSKSVELLRIAETAIVDPLRTLFPDVTFVFDIERIAGIGYYTTLCFKITAENLIGERYPLVDGGMSDWTQKLLHSKKERYFSSGIGSELFCNHFGC